MNYFSDCETIEQIKKQYRKLAQQFHPDHGGTNEQMADINSQYEKFRFQKFTAINHETNKTYEETFNPDDGYREIIDQLINLASITIELCGSWLWITGETKQHREILKELGFTFAFKKCAWYWKPGTYRKKSKKTMSMDWIRNAYGSDILNQREAITV